MFYKNVVIDYYYISKGTKTFNILVTTFKLGYIK